MAMGMVTMALSGVEVVGGSGEVSSRWGRGKVEGGEGRQITGSGEGASSEINGDGSWDNPTNSQG